MTDTTDKDRTTAADVQKAATDKKDAERLQSAHEWLTEAARVLGLDEKEATVLTRELLDLTKDVAHNRSRPAAPLTSFLVGLAAGDIEEARENIAKLQRAIAAGSPATEGDQ